MKIAFVGKGGSGKTTLSALFALFARQYFKNVLLIDGDINTHVASLLGFEKMDIKKHLSGPNGYDKIRQYLLGKNSRVKDLTHFYKTTPPTLKSNLVFLDDEDSLILKDFTMLRDNLRLMVVGSYEEEKVGSSCYHGNLAVLENVLSHIVDSERDLVVADMVAGVDAFANTMHAQFDYLVLVVEPTKRSIEVFEQYQRLAKAANVENSVLVLGNKIRDDRDKEFILENVSHDKVIGFFPESEYLRFNDQDGEVLNIEKLEDENRLLFEDFIELLSEKGVDYKGRLTRLYKLHRKLVSQPHIKNNYGDLSLQIDPNFDYEKVLRGGDFVDY